MATNIKTRKTRLWTALELRNAGFTYKEIGCRLNVSKERARQMVKRKINNNNNFDEAFNKFSKIKNLTIEEIPISYLTLRLSLRLSTTRHANVLYGAGLENSKISYLLNTPRYKLLRLERMGVKTLNDIFEEIKIIKTILSVK
ncbi:MAG TPA: hypothetical protein DCQ24_01860 [Bacteroidales bacterium]|nr:hypothetical protein [Bacteroidales bacterium]